MNFNRRRLFAAFAGVASVTAATPVLARNTREMHYMLDDDPAPTANSVANPAIAPRTAIEGASFGLRPNAVEDQTGAFQRAIDRAAAAHAVLHLTPGFYRAGGLRLPSYAAIAGVRGATRIVLSGGSSIFMTSGGDHISISGLVLDGSNIPVVQQHGLVELSQCRAARVTDCEIVNAGGNGITFEGVEGEITGNTIGAANNAIFSLDARGFGSPGTRCGAPAMAASWSGGRRRAMTARSSLTTALKASPTRPAVPASTATASMCFGPIMS